MWTLLCHLQGIIFLTAGLYTLWMRAYPIKIKINNIKMKNVVGGGGRGGGEITKKLRNKITRIKRSRLPVHLTPSFKRSADSGCFNYENYEINVFKLRLPSVKTMYINKENVREPPYPMNEYFPFGIAYLWRNVSFCSLPAVSGICSVHPCPRKRLLRIRRFGHGVRSNYNPETIIREKRKQTKTNYCASKREEWTLSWGLEFHNELEKPGNVLGKTFFFSHLWIAAWAFQTWSAFWFREITVNEVFA